MHRRARVAAMTALAVGALPATARGAGAVVVAWDAPAGCASAAAVERRASSLVPDGIHARAHATVTRRKTGYEVTLDIEGHGTRTLEGASCDALAASAAVVIAMSAIASAAEHDAPAPAPAPAPLPAPAPPAPAPTAEAPVAARERTEPAALALRADVGAELGLVPGVGPGFGGALGVDVLGHRLRLEAHAQAWLPREGHLATDPTRGARFGVISGGARACWSVIRGPEVAACAGARLARIDADGFGASRPMAGTTVTGGPEVLVAVRVPLSRAVGLRASVGGYVPLARPTFLIAGAGEVHTSTPIVASGFLGPEVRF